MASDRRRWSKLGLKNPFWASLPEQRFRANRMDASDEDAFFETGERDCAATFATIRALVGEDFHPARALDFGCGVGRVTIPLARECRRVLAVDISEPMLQVAARHCADRGILNVEFLNAREFSKETQRRVFDFVYAYNVFQHIGPRAGMYGTRRILNMLAAGGVAAMHYTYGRKAGPVRRTIHGMRRWLPPVNAAANLVQRRSLFEPVMPMYRYRLASLFELFRAQRCSIFNVEFTENRGHVGAMFYVRKGS
jgi:SAM-dependent methyltransferase